MLKEDILYALESRRGELLKGGWLAKELGVSRNAVWKAVNALRDEGNEIVSVPNSGYRLRQTNDTLLERIIRENLTTAFVGRRMELLSSVDSTNRYLREPDRMDAPSGSVVIADGQTGGRGRRNRPFLSPKGEGLYLSILLRPDKRQTDLRLLTLCAAVAVCRAIETVCGLRAEIKWVNDVYCNGKKICGILTEASLSGELREITSVVVGIGINTGRIPAELSGIATSVQEEAGLRGIRNRLAAGVLNQFEALCRSVLENGDERGMLAEYGDRLFIKNRKVLVIEAENRYPATVMGIGEAGALIVRDETGAVRHIVSGEIMLGRGQEL